MCVSINNPCPGRSHYEPRPFFRGQSSPSNGAENMASSSHAAFHMEALRRQRIVDRVAAVQRQREKVHNPTYIALFGV